jgi:hypothetical protein
MRRREFIAGLGGAAALGLMHVPTATQRRQIIK